MSNFFAGQTGPVNKKFTGPRQYLLAMGQQASAKLYTVLTRFRPCTSQIAAPVLNSHLGKALCNISCDQRCKTIHSTGKSEKNRCKSRCGYQWCICIRIVSESRFGQEKEAGSCGYHGVKVSVYPCSLVVDVFVGS